MEHGCPAKYNSFAESMNELICKRIEISRIWEDNRNILVQDQKQAFGCLNMACCSQVEQIISFRFAIVTSVLLTLCIFIGLFLMSV